jgi:hypothetical protein
LVLVRHEDDQDPVKELQPLEGGDPHVQENAEEDGHRDVAQQRGEEHGHADRQEDEDVGHPLFPHPQELGLLPGGRTLALELQGVDVVDGEDGRGDEPREAHDGADLDQDGEDEEVQVVAALLLQLVFFPVDDHARDLLIHEDEDGAEEGWGQRQEYGVDGVAVERVDEPTPRGQSRFELVRYLQFGRGDANLVVQEAHREDGDDDGEVADELTDLRGQKSLEEPARMVLTLDGKNRAFLKSFSSTDRRKVPRKSRIDMRNTSAT